MPRLVADQYHWHSTAATVCVGQSEHPGRLEWELRSGVLWARIDYGSAMIYKAFTLQKRTREARPALLLAASFVQKVNQAKPAGPSPLHNLGTTYLEHPPQCQIHHKTGAPTRIGAAAFTFEWRASGLTDVCFWTAPVVPPPAGILTLEGPVRFRLGPDCTLARLSPNRCLAGLLAETLLSALSPELPN